MNTITRLEKLILDATAKPAAVGLIKNLTDNRARNIADIQTLLGTGKVADAVAAFIIKEVKTSNPIVLELEALALPEFGDELNKVLGEADADVPTAYDEALAFLNKEVQYL